MRRELLEQLFAQAFNPRRVTVHDVARAVREITPDPIEAERRVGALYGHVFKRTEEAYDRALGQRCICTRFSPVPSVTHSADCPLWIRQVRDSEWDTP